MSCTEAGTALWEEVLCAHRRGEPGPAELVGAEWSTLSAGQQAAATRAGTALWREVEGRRQQL